MFSLFTKKVRVVFVDEATGGQIATSDVPLDQLPDTFAVNTELDLAGHHYLVVRAKPQTKAEFARTKRLAVTLQRVKMVDPNSILFSLPSICGAALPAASVRAAPTGTVALHEDDWRQCEYVASNLHEAIAVELSGVREIHANASAKVGWHKIHVRGRIGEPLPLRISWSKVTELLGSGDPVAGVAFGRSHLVDRAVGVRLPNDVVVWGVEDGGNLGVLCVENIDSASPSTIEVLGRVADELSLALVHWCRCAVYCRDIQVANATGTPWRSPQMS